VAEVREHKACWPRPTTYDGELAVHRALDGHGIMMRAERDIERYPDWSPF
jgi:hypothetical protein